MAPRTRKPNICQVSAAARRYKKQAKNETAQHREERLARQRESIRRRNQRETLLEKEERLAKSRWMQAHLKKTETFRAREKRLEKKRIQIALRKSLIRENLQRATRLMQTEDTFETILTKRINDQLHQIYRKVVRLTATNVKHMHIAPDTLDKDSNSETLCDIPLPIYSCPMEDGLNSDDESPFEPQVVVSELDYPQKSELIINIKSEPMASESYPDVSQNSEPMVSEPEVNSNPLAIEPDNTEMIIGDLGPSSGLIIRDISPNPEPMISETVITPQSQIETSVSADVKCEITIKPEVFTEEL